MAKRNIESYRDRNTQSWMCMSCDKPLQYIGSHKSFEGVAWNEYRCPQCGGVAKVCRNS